MQDLARIPMENGGSILITSDAVAGGPQKVGRLQDAIRDVPQNLQELLRPVRNAAETVINELKASDLEEIEVKFGVDLSAKAGAVISGKAKCHLQVRVQWKRENSARTA